MAFRLAQIAFAGHNRPCDIGDQTAAVHGLTAAFALLAAVGVEQGQLLTGLADGADVLAARAWSDAGLGPIHAVYPFLHDAPPSDLQLAVHASTWLDGAAFEARGRSAHLAQTRWLISAADLLVVLWDGQAGRGAGGTADAVRLALDAGIAVLWVEPRAGSAVRLIQLSDANRDYDFIELLEQLRRSDTRVVRLADVEVIGSALLARGFDVPEIPPDPDLQNLFDMLLHATVWRTYTLFRRAVGGPVRTSLRIAQPPEDLQAEHGFAHLSSAYASADRQANRLSSVHRSQQLLLLFAAVLATTIGASPAVWPAFKIYAVLGELGLALLALATWSGAARASRHERWSKSRRLAEQLRLERAAWALGLTAVLNGDGLGPAARTARTMRRAAGSAPGVFDEGRVTRWGGWALNELVTAQEAYHQHQGRRNEAIGHRVHLAENLSFMVLVACLVTFALTYGFARVVGLELPHWLGAAVLMLSAIVPAIGAASLALEANLAFREQGERSLFQAARLDTIRASIVEPIRLDDVQRAAQAAIQLNNSQEDRWSEEAGRRRLVRG